VTVLLVTPGVFCDAAPATAAVNSATASRPPRILFFTDSPLVVAESASVSCLL
jgi:hypothetical protein